MQTTDVDIYTATLACSDNGNWSLIVQARGDLAPLAFPASMTPSQAQDYAHHLIDARNIPTPPQLNWRPHGFTRTTEGSAPAYVARWRVTIENLDPQ